MLVKIDLSTLKDNGILIPQDSSMLSYLDWEQLSFLDPDLTARMAQHAANLGAPVSINGDPLGAGSGGITLQLSCRTEERQNQMVIVCTTK